jgi:hypothetical protein
MIRCNYNKQGILNAIKQVFSNCPQRYCLCNIYANVQTVGFRGEELKKYGPIKLATPTPSMVFMQKWLWCKNKVRRYTSG